MLAAGITMWYCGSSTGHKQYLDKRQSSSGEEVVNGCEPVSPIAMLGA